MQKRKCRYTVQRTVIILWKKILSSAFISKFIWTQKKWTQIVVRIIMEAVIQRTGT